MNSRCTVYRISNAWIYIWVPQNVKLAAGADLERLSSRMCRRFQCPRPVSQGGKELRAAQLLTVSSMFRKPAAAHSSASSATVGEGVIGKFAQTSLTRHATCAVAVLPSFVATCRDADGSVRR